MTIPAVLGPMIRVPRKAAAWWIAITSRAGICSVRITTVVAPASIASSAASRAAAGGMNMTAHSNGVRAMASPASA